MFFNRLLFLMSGFWLKDYCSGVEWTASSCGSSQVRVCCDPDPGIESTSTAHWRWSGSFLRFHTA